MVRRAIAAATELPDLQGIFDSSLDEVLSLLNSYQNTLFDGWLSQTVRNLAI